MIDFFILRYDWVAIVRNDSYFYPFQGKSPFLSRKKMMSSKVNSDEEKIVEKVDSEIELLHVKWSGDGEPETGSDETEAKTNSGSEQSANAIVSGWRNPVFRFESEPCHIAPTNSR